MEVAMAGGCMADLLKFAIEMMVHFAPATRLRALGASEPRLWRKHNQRLMLPKTNPSI
jgi:hypothetical protein